MTDSWCLALSDWTEGEIINEIAVPVALRTIPGKGFRHWLFSC